MNDKSIAVTTKTRNRLINAKYKYDIKSINDVIECLLDELDNKTIEVYTTNEAEQEYKYES